MTTTTITPQSWAVALLTKLGDPVTKNNVASILAWESAEGGHFHNSAHWNPLNTTLDHAKYGSINSDGVATYPDYQTGLDETVRTLDEPQYAAIRADLKNSADPTKTTAAVSASPWGTWKDGYSPAPFVQQAEADLKAHPDWVPKQPAHKPGVPKHTTNGGPNSGSPNSGSPNSGTGPTHGKDTKGKHPKDPKGKHPKNPKGKPHTPAGPPNPGAPSTKGNKIVLDLAELQTLATAYDNASQDVTGVRRKLLDMVGTLQPAWQALADKNLAWLVSEPLTSVTQPLTGFDSTSRQLADIGNYCSKIRTLAQQADANGDGVWTQAEALKFEQTHPYVKGDEAWLAVVAALNSGTIKKTIAGPANAGGNPPNNGGNPPKKGGNPPKNGGNPPKKGPNNGGDGPGKPGNPPAGSTTAARNSVVSLADKQHATEDNGNNVVKYNIWFGDPGQEWCATFVSWVFWHAGHKLPAIQGPKGFAYVPYAITYATEHHQLDAKPQVGDIFLLKDGSHTGIVTHVNSDGSFDTVEGNSGNMVAHHTRANDGSYDFWDPYKS